MPDSHYNPIGLDGFDFVEFAAPDPAVLDTVFKSLGFQVVADHRSKDVKLDRHVEFSGRKLARDANPSSESARTHCLQR